VISRSGGAGRDYCNGGAWTVRPGAMTPHCPSNRPYLYPPASEAPLLIPPVRLYAFCPIGDGLYQPAFLLVLWTTEQLTHHNSSSFSTINPINPQSLIFILLTINRHLSCIFNVNDNVGTFTLRFFPWTLQGCPRDGQPNAT